MQYSLLSNSLRMAVQNKKDKRIRLLVILLRILVGGTFVLSGLSKSIDIWGFIYKIEQYFSVWSIDIHRQLVVVLATALSIGEFLLGGFILFGCYRRVSVWLSAILMAGMTFFSIYLVIDNPVSDCGCFGELITVGNWPTLIKNLLLCVGIYFLIKYNRRVKGFYNTYLNWTVGVALLAYVSIVAFVGYAFQPMADFRDFKVGTLLFAQDDANVDVVYSRDGVTKRFSSDNLPDSTWTFVDVVENENSRLTLSIFGGDEEGDELTDEIASKTDKMLFVSIPDLGKVPTSAVTKVNGLKRIASSDSAQFVVVTGSGADARQRWNGLSLNEYPLYTSDDTTLKALVRGDVGLVYVTDGIIRWKMNADAFDNSQLHLSDISATTVNFTWLNVILAVVLLILKIIDTVGVALKPRFYGKSRKKDVTLHSDLETSTESAYQVQNIDSDETKEN